VTTIENYLTQKIGKCVKGKILHLEKHVDGKSP
jgi:hypothetical protein